MKSNLDYINDFLFLIQDYALEPNENLTKGAIKLKKQVINHIKLYFNEKEQEEK